MKIKALENMGIYNGEYSTVCSVNTWTEGLIYTLTEQEDNFVLSSNEGEESFPNYEKEAVLSNFKKIN